MAQTQKLEKKNRVDWVMLIVVALLVGFGLLMVYSASSYEAQIKWDSALYFVKKQAIAVVIGLVGLAAAALIPVDFWKSRVSYIVYILAFGATLMVLSPIGIESNGARRWIDLKVMTLQPAEFLKVGVILVTAALIVRFRKKLGTVLGFILAVLPVLAAAFIVATVTDDLGTAMIIFAMGIIMIFIAAPKRKYVVALVAVIVAAGLVFVFSKSYRLTRIKAWLNLEAYADSDGYQPLQALYAIASGGLTGKGLGKSTQKLGFIPESENDMIFSIICEELGVLGGIGLMVLIIFLLWRMYRIYRSTDDMFSKLVVAGVIGHIGTQTFLNTGVVSSLLPNTGVPLPFISYGGSSIMMLLIEIGLVVSVSRRKSVPAKAAAGTVKAGAGGGTETLSGINGEVHQQTKTGKIKKVKKPRVVREDKRKGVIYYR